MAGTSVEVEAFAEEYMELAADIGSTRLVVEAFAKPGRRKFDVEGVFPGEGKAGGALLSLSLESAMFFGLKSFIFELLLLGSLSGGGPSVKFDGSGGGGTPGENRGLLPLGNATLAAVVAASLLPPTVPLLYESPVVDT